MYELADHTADVVIRAYGESWEEVFSAMAKALFASMLDISRVERRLCKTVSLSSEALEDLLVDFLNELVVYKDSENLALPYAELTIGKEGKTWFLEGKVCGEKIDPSRHEPFSDVKAVSYHMLEVGEKEGRKYAQVVLDL